MRMTNFFVVNDVVRGYVLYDKKPPKPSKPIFMIPFQVPVNEDDPEGSILPEDGVVIKLDGSDIREVIRNYIVKPKGRSVGSQLMR